MTAGWLKRLICKAGHVDKDVCVSVRLWMCVFEYLLT